MNLTLHDNRKAGVIHYPSSPEQSLPTRDLTRLHPSPISTCAPFLFRICIDEQQLGQSEHEVCEESKALEGKIAKKSRHLTPKQLKQSPI